MDINKAVLCIADKH